MEPHRDNQAAAHPAGYPTGNGMPYKKLFERLEEGCAHCRMLFDGGQPVDWIYLEVNPAFSTLTGLKEVEGRKVSELLPGIRASSPDLFDFYARAARGGAPETLESFVPSMGIWCSVHAFNAGPDAFIATFRNLTRLRAAEDAVPASEDSFRSLFEFSPVPITLTRPSNGVIVLANRAWAEFTGIPLEEAIGQPVTGLVNWANPHEWDALMAGLRQSGQMVERECTFQRRDGPELRVLITAKVQPFQGEDLVMAVGKDVTRRHRAEAELQRSEAQFQNLFSSLSIGITLTDATGHIIKTNPASEDLLGIPADDLLRRNFKGPYWEIIRPDHSLMPPEEYASIRALKEQRRIENIEMGVRHPAGQIGWILATAEPAPWADAGVLITYVDISDRKQAEREARRTQLLNEQMIQSAQEGIVIYDVDLKYRVWNPYMERLTGLSAGEVIGRHPSEVLHFIKQRGGIEDRRKVLAGETVAPQEFPYQIPSTGKSGWVREALSPLLDWEGRITGVIVTVNDITERKQTEQALAESEGRFRAMFELSSAVMLMIDADSGIILDANHAAVTYYGHPLDEIRGSSIARFNQMPTKELLGHMALASRRGINRFEFKHHLATGEIRDVEVFSSPIQIGGRTILHSIIHDITERKAAEQAVVNSEGELALAFHASPDAIVLSNVSNGVCLKVNDAFVRTTGIPMAEVFGKSSCDLGFWFAPLDRERWLTALQRDGRVDNQEVTLRLSNERQITGLVSSRLVTWNNELAQISSFRDITMLKELEGALKRREAEYRLLFEHGMDGILFSAPDGRIFNANPAACVIFGRTVEEFRETGRSGIMDTSDPRLAMAVDARERMGHWTGELTCLRGDGMKFPVEMSSTIFVDEAGERRASSFIRDISERNQAEQALRVSEANLSEALTLAQAGHWDYEVDTDTFTLTDGFLRIYRTTAEAQGGHTMSSAEYVQRFCHPDDIGLVTEEIQRALQTPNPDYRRTLEHRFRYADGETGDLTVRFSIIKDPDGNTARIRGVNQDITDRKQIERELARRQAELEALNSSLESRIQESIAQLRTKDQILITQGRQAAMGEMIGNIAHQWRQPLNALSMVLANLKDEGKFGTLDPAVLEKPIATGNELIQKMSTTINDFMGFFRPDKAQTAFSLLEQVRGSLSLVDASLKARGISLEIDVPSDVRLFGYPNEYSQVLLNLVNNAREAIESTGVGAGRIGISFAQDGGYGCLAVRDNGGGIPKKYLDRIFDPYFSTKESGTGIGLYMSRQIIAGSMKGQLSARNVAGGAEFTVKVPLAEGDS